MRPNAGDLVTAVLLLVASAIWIFAWPDVEFFWFRGQPFGVVVGIIGILELLNAFRRRGRAVE